MLMPKICILIVLTRILPFSFVNSSFRELVGEVVDGYYRYQRQCEEWEYNRNNNSISYK